jgi:hypothetical protein
MHWARSFVLALFLPSVGWAQASSPTVVRAQPTLKFQAQVLPNGDVKLVPDGKAVGITSPEASPSSPDLSFPLQTKSASELFMVKNANGIVKGIFGSQNAALSHPLEAGDKVEVLAASANVALPDTAPANDDYLVKVAQQAAKQLLTAAKESACGFDPLPETITPTVEVSFSLFAGGSLSVSATWDTTKICKK